MRERLADRHVAPDHFLSIDIETVPDTPADFPAASFPKPAQHRVVCVSFARGRIAVDPDTGLEHYLLDECRSGGEEGWGEARLLAGFWKLFGSRRFRLVGWNTRRFDVPVLATRSMLHGISAAPLYRAGDRWNGYVRRYSPEWHADVMDILSGYAAAPSHGLDEIAVALGLPGKAGESGAEVAAMIATGQIARVRRYCEADCLNCLAAYIRLQFLMGLSDERGHDAGMRSVASYLAETRAERPHLGDFLDRWMTSRRPGSLLSSGKNPDQATAIENKSHADAGFFSLDADCGENKSDSPAGFGHPRHHQDLRLGPRTHGGFEVPSL